jgi:NTE family protein
MPTNVAIACQGGGSHTAFTAGVLRTLLPELADSDDRLVGLSGTSGGAISAAAALSGYLDDGAEGAVDTLDALWGDIAADEAFETWFNAWLVQGMSAHHWSFPTPTVSPYGVPATAYGERKLREILDRHVDVEALSALADPDTPHLVVGTVDINAGRFETFEDEHVTVDALLASSAVPTLFRAVEIDGHYHWDGLFSQNPPIQELLHTDPERKPEELWVVQINPQSYEGEPTDIADIVDRRNELAGNISLNQELRFVETVNHWLDRGDLPAEKYTHTEIRRISLDEQLSYESKLDRSTAFIERLTARGIEAAEAFLGDLGDGHEHAAQFGFSHDEDRRRERPDYGGE